MSLVTVATDGGCIGNAGDDPAGWAWYVDPDNYQHGHLPNSTNNKAELTAILWAVKMIPSELDLLILADSQYAIKALSHGSQGWIDGWAKRGWVTSSGGPVKNSLLIQTIDKAIAARKGKVTFQWVKGHAGHPLNAEADRLANTAARTPWLGVTAGPGWANAPEDLVESAPAIPSRADTIVDEVHALLAKRVNCEPYRSAGHEEDICAVNGHDDPWDYDRDWCGTVAKVRQTVRGILALTREEDLR